MSVLEGPVRQFNRDGFTEQIKIPISQAHVGSIQHMDYITDCGGVDTFLDRVKGALKTAVSVRVREIIDVPRCAFDERAECREAKKNRSAQE